MAEKKYYWLKMTDQFFEDKAIKKLRKIAGGDTYTIIYLKMLLTAIKQGNKMYFEGIEDDFMEELALELDEDTDNVKVSGTCLKPGDILLNDNHHVAIAVSGDASSNATPAKKNYLEKGDSGSEVTTMQKMLIKVGYSCGSAGADGDFGSGTDEALRKFQKDNGLVVDGQYGTNSKAKLTALYNKKVGTTTSTKKDVTTVAKEVIAGKWGSGDERKKKLTAAGYNYDTVQKKVNELLKTSTKKSVAEVAKEVVSGKWGNGADRKKKLEAAGYNYAEVQKEVNKLLK